MPLKPIPEIVQSIRKNIACLTAAQAMADAAQKDGLVIDVREPSEVMEKPASKSLNIPRGVLEMRISNMLPLADKPLYLHCASGARATLAAEQLKRIGYEDVTIITCPIEDVCQSQR